MSCSLQFEFIITVTRLLLFIGPRSIDGYTMHVRLLVWSTRGSVSSEIKNLRLKFTDSVELCQTREIVPSSLCTSNGHTVSISCCVIRLWWWPVGVTNTSTPRIEVGRRRSPNVNSSVSKVVQRAPEFRCWRWQKREELGGINNSKFWFWLG